MRSIHAPVGAPAPGRRWFRTPRGYARSRVAPWVLIGLPALFLVTFFYVPILTVLSRGFRSADGTFSLATVIQLLSDPYILRLIRFTTLQALGSSLLSTVIGVPLAYALARLEFPGRRWLASVTMLPFVLPSITVALGFLLLFGTNGWLNQALRSAFGFEVRILHSLWAILLAHAFYNAPVVARMTQAAWEQIDPRLEESARSLGATPFGVWRDVTLPALLPAVLGGAALAFIYSFMSFPIVLALGGARFATLEVEIFTQVHVLWDWETGAALAAVQAALSLGFVYAVLRLQREPAAFSGQAGRSRRRHLLASDRSLAGKLLAIPLIAAGVLFFLGPIAATLHHSLQRPGGGLSLASYARVLSARHSALIGDSPVAAVANSLTFGLTAGALALVAGVAFTYGFLQLPSRRKTWLETLALAPLVVSSVALGFGVLLAFRRPPFDAIGPDWRVIITHALLSFPFAVRAVRPVLANLDRRLSEAARTLGAGPLGAFLQVELPLAAGGIFAAFALAFGLSVGEMSATMMLARPGLVTMPVSVYRFLAARDFHTASAMAVLLMLVTGGVFASAEWLSQLLARELRSTRAGARTDGRGRPAGERAPA